MTCRTLPEHIASFLSSGGIHVHPVARYWGTWWPVSFEMMPWGKGIRLGWLEVQPEHARKGWARQFMSKLCQHADSRRISLFLEVRTKGDRRITGAALRAFYASLGFVQDRAGGGSMVRRPRWGSYRG